MSSVTAFVQQFGNRWSDQEVEAAVWKLAGDAAAEGRLLVDLTEVVLDCATPLALLAPGSSPILPDPLPSRLQSAEDDKTLPPSPQAGDEPPLAPQGVIPGPIFDASTLEDAEDRSRFYRNLQAVTAVLTGESRRQVAQQYGMCQRLRNFGSSHFLVKR